MPNNNYQPNDPRHYDAPEDYPLLSGLLGYHGETDYQAANESRENYRAFLMSRLPNDLMDKELAMGFFHRLEPHYQPPQDPDARRALSEQAREAIVDLVAAVKASKRDDIESGSVDRTFYLLFMPGDSPEIKEKNDAVKMLITGGSPEAKGNAFEQRIREAKALFDRSREGLTDQEVVDNLLQIHICHEVVVNAQNILSLKESGKIVLSDDVTQILKDMEREAPRLDMLKQRAKLIANPLYEYIDPMELVQYNSSKIMKLSEETEHLPGFNEFLRTAMTYQEESHTLIRDKLMEKIKETFDLEKDAPKIQLIDWEGNMRTHECDSTSMAGLANNLGNSGIMVTGNNGAVAFYEIDENGEPVKVPATKLQNDFVGSFFEKVKTLKEDVAEANKGFFIGSDAYKTAANSMEALFDAARNMSNPPTPEEKEQIKELLTAVVANCEAYMNQKEEERGTDERDRVLFKNAREENRYRTMERVKDSAYKMIYEQTLLETAVTAEAKAAQDFISSGKGVEFPVHPIAEVNQKVLHTYASSHLINSEGVMDKNYVVNDDNVVNTRIPASDVGSIADELRASINMSLNDVMLTKGNFDGDDARNIMSNMVVLEMVKAGRSVDTNGNILAGPVERALSENPGQLIQSIRDNPYFQRVTEEVSLDMLKHFVMSDGAKKLANQLISRTLQSQENQQPEKVEQLEMGIQPG